MFELNPLVVTALICAVVCGFGCLLWPEHLRSKTDVYSVSDFVRVLWGALVFGVWLLVLNAVNSPCKFKIDTVYVEIEKVWV